MLYIFDNYYGAPVVLSSMQIFLAHDYPLMCCRTARSIVQQATHSFSVSSELINRHACKQEFSRARQVSELRNEQHAHVQKSDLSWIHV